MRLFLLLLHGVSATLLIGAITHQAIAAWWPGTTRAGFFKSLRAVHAPRYTAAVIVLFTVTIVLGSVIYPPFRSIVRAHYLDASVPWATGLFEIKEHAAAVALALLPAYWALWRGSSDLTSRRAVTTILAVLAWWNVLVGHVVNNVRGL